jgi:hypothetical protein
MRGGVTRNTVIASQLITINNTGTVSLTFTSIRTSSGQYIQTNTCPATLTAGANCTVSVTFAPTSRGPKNATLQVNVAAPGTSQLVTLSKSAVPARRKRTGHVCCARWNSVLDFGVGGSLVKITPTATTYQTTFCVMRLPQTCPYRQRWAKAGKIRGYRLSKPLAEFSGLMIGSSLARSRLCMANAK